MRFEVINVTPDIAEHHLKNNGINRPLNKGHVKKLANVILRGEWEMNGSPIRYARTGRLIDGQHRLNAVIMAGVPVPMLFVYGLEESSFDTIDVGGRARIAADVLQIVGVKNATTAAATATLIHKHRKLGNPYGAGDENPSPRQIEDMLSSSPEIEECVSYAMTNRSKFIPPSHIAFMRHCFIHEWGCEEHLVDGFFDGLLNGVGLSTGDPVLLARERLLDSKTGTSKTPLKLLVALIFKAFRYHLAGRQLKILKIATEGVAREKDWFRPWHEQDTTATRPSKGATGAPGAPSATPRATGYAYT